MAEKKYYWLKLKEDFFRQKEIKKLRRIAGGDTYTIIYLKMQLLSLKNEGILFFEGTEESFEEQISLEIDEELDNVKVTLAFLFANNLIEEFKNNEYFLSKASECIGKEGKSAERVRRHREKQALKQIQGQTSLQCNDLVTKCNTETEIEIEQEIEQQQDIEEILNKNFKNQDIETIKKYCIENNVVVDVVVEKLEIINHMKTVRNKVGALLTAIKEDWKASKSQNNSVSVRGFNNFEAREYDYDSLEKKLLGWEDKKNEYRED
ncbi:MULTISPECIES: phage replisome organizer N-terminal domain-containing protein [unclassified Clostridium]|uniref:phage replisome organizer N-terminal domain-containing protein n=1 Tax=unclassified Clostridium TaxID=2614128 RepID=UPI002079E048|nr:MULTISPECIES: phage replisome organizer N-terminal domain-containing protein [unclassified Clostridium]